MKCKPSIQSRASKLEFRVTFAERAGKLYVRLTGRADDDIKESRRMKIRKALSTSPRNPMQLAVLLRESGDFNADAQLVESILGQMLREGEVLKQDGGTWTANPKAKKA